MSRGAAATSLISSGPDQQYSRYDVQGTIFELPRKYELKYAIGQGAYGIVCSGRNTETDELVAVKKIFSVFEHDKEFQKRILRELRILKHFKHENIIALKDLVLPRAVDSFEDVYIVTDLMDTDLRQIIKSDQPLSEQHIQYFLYQILRALKYIHSANVLHRDLKPGNLLLNSDCELKICDFGLSRGINFELDPTMSTSYVATRWYRAPELLLQWEKATKAIDVWSVGCIFAEMLERKVLFPGKNYLNQLDLILDLVGSPKEEDIRGSDKARKYLRNLPRKTAKNLRKVFPNVNPSALDLLSKMLIFNPEKRISVEQALEHPFMESMHDPEDEPSCTPTFDFSFEEQAENGSLKEMIYETIVDFHRENQEQLPGAASSSTLKN